MALKSSQIILRINTVMYVGGIIGMLIHHKGIKHNRFEDIPDGIGTLVIAPECHRGCPNCCNEHLKSTKVLTSDSQDLIKDIVEDHFSDWIIFAGLDPLTYPEELYEMIRLSLENNLKIIIYTGEPDREHLLSRAPGLSTFSGKGILVKYGEYDESKKVYDYYSHDILLATSNQYVDYL